VGIVKAKQLTSNYSFSDYGNIVERMQIFQGSRDLGQNRFQKYTTSFLWEGQDKAVHQI